MKKIYLLLIAALTFAACDSPKTNDYSLKGNFGSESYNGKTVYLQMPAQEPGKFTAVDSTRVENNTFEFTGTVDKVKMLYVSAEGFKRPQLFIAGEGQVEMSIDSLGAVTLKGPALNSKYQEYIDKGLSLFEEMDEKGDEISAEVEKAKAEGRLTPEMEKEAEAKYEALYENVKSYSYTFAKDNLSNVVGRFVFLDRGRSFSKEQLDEIVPMLDADLKNNPQYARIETYYSALTNTAVGQKFTNIKALTPEGNEIALSDYAGKGKYVLVDFWASWCPPCRKDMPEVVRIYNLYKDKGFEIVGVSLDRKKDEWEEKIKDFNITWPQMSDLKYWEAEPAATYAVNSIPHMVLIDPEGTIIAKKIGPGELEEKLSELLK